MIQPKYGYGKEGFAPHVEPDAVLDFEIELVSFGVRRMFFVYMVEYGVGFVAKISFAGRIGKE